MKKTTKHTVLFAVLFFQLFFTLGVKAQPRHSYTFSKTSNNLYADLAGDINVPTFDSATQLYFVTNFQGETFQFFNDPFTFGGLSTVTMGEAPFMRIDNDSSLVIIDAAFSYIDSIDATSRKSYLVQGGPGNRILKFQYKNQKLRYGQTGNYINVQIWYYQQTGVIEIHYGPRSANNASGYNTANGPNVGIFYAPDDFSTCYEKLWVNGSPASVTLDSAATLVFRAMSGVADSGTIYRFTPRPTQPPVVTGIGTLATTGEIRIYPNPASDKIILNGPFENAELRLIGPDGHLVTQVKNIPHNGFELNVSELPSGLYLMQIYTLNAVILRKITITSGY